jgi:hypothetical protein
VEGLSLHDLAKLIPNQDKNKHSKTRYAELETRATTKVLKNRHGKLIEIQRQYKLVPSAKEERDKGIRRDIKRQKIDIKKKQ